MEKFGRFVINDFPQSRNKNSPSFDVSFGNFGVIHRDSDIPSPSPVFFDYVNLLFINWVGDLEEKPAASLPFPPPPPPFIPENKRPKGPKMFHLPPPGKGQLSLEGPFLFQSRSHHYLRPPLMINFESTSEVCHPENVFLTLIMTCAMIRRQSV